MRPEFSIIFLTTLAGAGQGLFVFLAGADFKSVMNGEPLPGWLLAAGAAVSLALAALGTLASFFHLSHKMRGVKAIRRWKSSWLSREVILLPAFQGIAALYALAAFAGAPGGLRLTVGAAGVTAAFALFLSSGMIYAAVRFIREWSTAYTPMNFTLIGLAAGAMAAVAVFETGGAEPAATLGLLRGAFFVTALGAVMKFLAYRREGSLYSPSSVQTALGINHPEIRLMDFGASYDHYNTKEYNHTKLAQRRGVMKGAVMIGLFVLPLVMMMFEYYPLLKGGSGSLGVYIAAVMILFSMLERWLFFAEGNHVQNLYYGAFREKGAANPLLQPGKASAPLPPR